jgi:ribosomal peptide maturation radical SAM protein 1
MFGINANPRKRFYKRCGFSGIDLVDVSLVVMPFGSIQRPSIGVSLLKAALTKIGISCKVYYFNIKFAELVGLETYNKLAETSLDSPLIGELVFSRFVFYEKPWSKSDISSMVRHIFEAKQYPYSRQNALVDKIVDIQGKIPEFLDNAEYNIRRDKPKIIGFSSTFEQNCASLCLAKIAKENCGVPIIFGGANCEGEMGYTLLQNSHWVDFICSGEGDIAFVKFVKNIIDKASIDKINGIITRNSSPLEIAVTNPIMNMDSLEFPDYDDYFTYFNRSEMRKYLNPELVIETSRGCWWGDKFQCTFCGLNGSTMMYRSKSIPRVLEELRFLANKYDVRKFQVVDNILDLKYIESLFPLLASERSPISLFYETKANISKNQLAIMKTGGVVAIQPGIESLSDAVLNIIKKGVLALQNIQILKWCSELDIVPLWNLIWGFPTEPEDEYTRMANLVPKLVHLHPPSGFGKLTLDRFSPYFLEPSRNGIVCPRPWTAYKYLYPKVREEDLNKIAYHFDFEYQDSRNPALYTSGLQQELVNWQNLWKLQRHKGSSVPKLSMVTSGEALLINDTRPIADQRFRVLVGDEAFIYRICETMHSLPSILVKMQDKNPTLGIAEIEDMLNRLVDKKLTIIDNGQYLSLAVSANSE